MHSKTGAQFRPIQTFIQQLHHLQSKFVDLQVCRVNVRLSEVCQERWRYQKVDQETFVTY